MNLSQHTILIVDDEPDLLNSMVRVFEEEPYRILTANSGHEGIEILKINSVSLILSDYNMPEMNGIDFLEKTKSISFDSIRLLMTGFGDVKILVSAINSGQIYRFIPKPWNVMEMKLTLRDCLKNYDLSKENEKLSELLSKKNEKLKDLNKDLHDQLDEKTKQIHTKNLKLEEMIHSLDQSLTDTVRMILTLISNYSPNLCAHSKRVAAFSLKMGNTLQLSTKELKDLEVASLLHDIGKINLPSELIFKNPHFLTSKQKEALRQHPQNGSDIIKKIHRFEDVSKIVLHHHELIDGSGYPAGLKNKSIPKLSKIIGLADQFDILTNSEVPGVLSHPPETALQMIQKDSGELYDPEIVACLIKIFHR